jgi:membrane protein involved in colicin uptake
MKNLQPLILLTLCLLCLSPLSFAGKIYKWTDSEGQVHYGERPPSGQAKQIKVPTGPAHSPSPPAKPASRQEATQKLLDSFDKERKDKAEAETKAAKEKARREKNCSSARRRIAGLKIGGRQYEVDEQGNRHYLSEAEIQSRLAEAQQYADKWCK